MRWFDLLREDNLSKNKKQSDDVSKIKTNNPKKEEKDFLVSFFKLFSKMVKLKKKIY
jgi:hypothetical protein